MTVEREVPGVEPSEADSRYSFRILREIDSQQEQISAQTVGQARRSAANSPNLEKANRRHAIPAPKASSKTDTFTVSQEATPRAPAQRDLEKEFHRREQMLRRKLELQKWHGKYNSMLIEASPEYRLGALMKKIAGDAKGASATQLLAHLGDLDAPESDAIRSEIERILREGQILEELLPLLDQVPNI